MGDQQRSAHLRPVLFPASPRAMTQKHKSPGTFISGCEPLWLSLRRVPVPHKT